MQALESAETVRRSAVAGVAAVQGSGRFLRYIGLAATGLVAAAVCTFAVKGTRARVKALPALPKSGLLHSLLLQGATIVLFPYLRELLSKHLTTAAPTAHADARPRALTGLSRYSPTRLFFRWLGLDT